MQVPMSPDQQKCGGIIDKARLLQAEIGGEIMNTMEKAALKILETLVVNEVRIVEKGPITLSAMM